MCVKRLVEFVMNWFTEQTEEHKHLFGEEMEYYLTSNERDKRDKGADL